MYMFSHVYKLTFIFLAVYEPEQVLLNVTAKEILQLYSTAFAKDLHKAFMSFKEHSKDTSHFAVC